MTTDTEVFSQYPAWLREVDVALTSASHLILSGNTRDVHLVPVVSPGGVRYQTLTTVEAVQRVLERAGFRTMVHFDPVNGATALLDQDGRAGELLAAQSAQGSTGEGSPSSRSTAAPLGDPTEGTEQLIGLVRALPGVDPATALIVEGAPRLAPGGDVQDPAFHRLIVVAERSALEAEGVPVSGSHRAPLYRPVVWILDRPNELPTWFVSGRRVRAVSVPAVALTDRQRYARVLVSALPDAPSSVEKRNRLASEFADVTAGLSLTSMLEITRLAVDQGIEAAQIGHAVRMYRVGIPENPWDSDDLRERIRKAPERLSSSVLGQPHAVRKAVDILIRSTSGMRGAQSRSAGSRPQGVLFFAGPTGVGKTELAKELAALVFGNRDSMHRFDMSEFSQEQSEARLIGSPPGFRDHDSGGELTNAVRQDPFSLILFDEIDKAHPRILDKFLQILEDGRLTDGSGSTVHFSETLIVFTSNLGIYELDEFGSRRQVVSQDAEYDEVERKVRKSIKEHFTLRLGRPEILNRIGDNVVVFDFIDPEIGAALAAKSMADLATNVRESQGFSLTWKDSVLAQIQEAACQNLEFGGRGVTTIVESMVVNPLARAVFALEQPPSAVEVTSVVVDEAGWSLDIRHTD